MPDPAMQHTPECAAAQAANIAAQDAWRARWPNACKSCQGAGGKAFRYDPSPAGIGLSPGYMWDFDPCPACEGRCPRCGQPAPHDADVPCPACGWNYGKGKDDACPEPIEECWCFDEEPSHA